MRRNRIKTSVATHVMALQPKNANIADKPVREDIAIIEHAAPHRKRGRMLNLFKGDIDDFIYGNDDKPHVSEK